MGSMKLKEHKTYLLKSIKHFRFVLGSIRKLTMPIDSRVLRLSLFVKKGVGMLNNLQKRLLFLKFHYIFIR